MKIKGKVVSTFGAANTNLKFQIPSFMDLPHKDSLYFGTINIDISPRQFKVIKYDYFFRDVAWDGNLEDIGFICVTKIEHKRTAEHDACYLYLPSKSPNMQNGNILEVWTEWIEGLNINDEITIELPNEYISISHLNSII